MKQCSLNDISKYSRWPKILLGLEKFDQKVKNKKELDREYEIEKWGILLEKVKGLKTFSYDYIEAERHKERKELLCYEDGKFHFLESAESLNKFLEIVEAEISPHGEDGRFIVEIGAGDGSVLFNLIKRNKFKQMNFLASEYTSSGKELLSMIVSSENLDIEIAHCDITKNPIFDKAMPDKAIYYTSYVTSLIPELGESFIDSLIDLNPKAVIHFEPIYEHTLGETLLDLMRKRYIELNDYNRNLLTLLKDCESKKKIRILEEKPLAFGRNALFPFSVLVWEPV